MIKFLKSLVGSLQQPSPMKKVPIDEMSLSDIIAYSNANKDHLQEKELLNLLKRLYEIALWDNHVPDQQREMAIELTNAITQDLEKAYADNSDALMSLKDCKEIMTKDVQLVGYGSLAWKIKEESIPNKDVVAYAMQPKHRHLIPNFLTVVGTENIKKHRREYIRQIILSEDYEGMNAVIMMHGLAAKGDKAVVALLSSDEFKALMNVPKDYTAGRNVLVSLDLLPKESGARPFKHISNVNAFVACAIKSRMEEDEADSRLDKLSEEEKMDLLTALTLLRIVLAYGQLQQIYDKETADQMMNMEAFNIPIIKEGFKRVSRVLEKLAENNSGTPIDSIILFDVLSWRGHDVATEEEYQKLQPYLDMGADWMNHERVGFQSYFRYMLRAVGDPARKINSNVDQELVNHLLMAYKLNGANASVAENWAYFEDWIGIV